MRQPEPVMDLPEQNVPVFVYGTLMEGFGNHSYILKGNTRKKINGKLKGFRMISLGAFPMLLHTNEDKEVVGELHFLNKDRHEALWRRMDQLEGNGHFYLREPVVVKGEDGNEYTAWVYVGMSERMSAPDVPEGDWRAYVSNNRREY